MTSMVVLLQLKAGGNAAQPSVDAQVGNSDSGGKTGDANDSDAPSSGVTMETNRDPMFVPKSAPHPPEYYCYDLVGITIHSGTANGGHYFSYIRERKEIAEVVVRKVIADRTRIKSSNGVNSMIVESHHGQLIV